MKLALLMVMKLERKKNKDKKVTQTCVGTHLGEENGKRREKKKMFYLAYCTGQLVSHGHYNDGPTVLLISVGVLRLKMGFCSFD